MTIKLVPNVLKQSPVVSVLGPIIESLGEQVFVDASRMANTQYGARRKKGIVRRELRQGV